MFQAVRTLRMLARAFLERVDRRLLPVAALGQTLSALYFTLANPRFRREQQAVLAGRLAYERRAAAVSDPLLRRNIHRLEKGLIMKPRQRVFARDYIGETVAAYERAERSDTADPTECRWAHDVLSQFFSVVEDAPEIARARLQFATTLAFRESATFTESREVDDHSSWAPFLRTEGTRATVDYEAFIGLCRQRRSVRWFTTAAVPNELIEQAIAAAVQAPSACNRQPYFFRFFERHEDASRIADIAMGTTGYAQQIPALIVVLGDLSCFPHERDRHLPYIDGALAAMQLMLALETLGLGSCPINWPDIEHLERRMAEELQLPRWIRPIMLLAVGYPDPLGGIAFSAKKPVHGLLRTDNTYPA